MWARARASHVLSDAAAIDYMLRDQAMMAAAKNYFAWQARLVLRRLGRRVLEIGCGTGNFTRHLLDRELVIAADREPAMLERLAARFGNRPNLKTVAVDAGDAASLSQLARFRPDSCVCLNVLEHVRDDVAALRAMSSAMPAGAPVILIVPAFPLLYGPVDRNLGHFRRYTRSSIRAIAQAAGLRVLDLRFFNFAGFFGWWLNARVFHRQAQSPAQIALFDRLIVPVMSRIEPCFGPPLGQSLFSVLSGGTG